MAPRQTTESIEPAQDGARKAATVPLLDPDQQESLAPIDTIALRRRAEASEVGKVVAWLASDGASYVSGNSMLIDGALMEGI